MEEMVLKLLTLSLSRSSKLSDDAYSKLRALFFVEHKVSPAARYAPNCATTMLKADSSHYKLQTSWHTKWKNSENNVMEDIHISVWESILEKG
jgi:hypothetical protein